MIPVHHTPSRRQSVEEVSKRRFHAKVRKIKDYCAEHNVDLFKFNEADIDYVCVMSDNDYELTLDRQECSSSNENYFVTPNDYQTHSEEFNSFLV